MLDSGRERDAAFTRPADDLIGCCRLKPAFLRRIKLSTRPSRGRIRAGVHADRSCRQFRRWRTKPACGKL